MSGWSLLTRDGKSSTLQPPPFPLQLNLTLCSSKGWSKADFPLYPHLNTWLKGTRKPDPALGLDREAVSREEKEMCCEEICLPNSSSVQTYERALKGATWRGVETPPGTHSTNTTELDFYSSRCLLCRYQKDWCPLNVDCPPVPWHSEHK